MQVVSNQYLCCVEELYSLELNYLFCRGPVYGLTLLYKWRPEEKDDRPVLKEYKDLFFANQVINNACVTQAILSILTNCSRIDIGPVLSGLKEFAKDFPSELKALAINNYAAIRDVHNSFARPEFEEQVGDGEEDAVCHFISYFPVKDVLYEFDGMKEGPISLGKCKRNGDEWLKTALPVIQERIEFFSKNGIRFNLLVLTQNKKDFYTAQLEELQHKKGDILEQLEAEDSMDADSEAIEEVKALLAETDSQIEDFTRLLAEEEERSKQWKEDNIRHKHNYIPFLFNFLKILAEKKQLEALIDKAKKS
eukprot:Gb_31151 [translate_table: standard]